MIFVVPIRTSAVVCRSTLPLDRPEKVVPIGTAPLSAMVSLAARNCNLDQTTKTLECNLESRIYRTHRLHGIT